MRSSLYFIVLHAHAQTHTHTHTIFCHLSIRQQIYKVLLLHRFSWVCFTKLRLTLNSKVWNQVKCVIAGRLECCEPWGCEIKSQVTTRNVDLFNVLLCYRLNKNGLNRSFVFTHLRNSITFPVFGRWGEIIDHYPTLRSENNKPSSDLLILLIKYLGNHRKCSSMFCLMLNGD